MKRVVLRSVLLLGSSIAVYCAIVMVFHEQIMRRLYLGDQYQGHGHVIVILALALLTYALGIPATQALASIERPEVVFKATCISLGISVVLIPVLILAFGLTGAAYGNLVANLISTVGRWVGFFGHLPRDARLRSEP
jgi:O-antigen/teichoic acid export membrane protein